MERSQRSRWAVFRTDLITLSESANSNLQIGIVTDDSDLLPAVAAAGMRIRDNMSVTLLRCSTDTSYLDSYLLAEGVTIVRATIAKKEARDV